MKGITKKLIDETTKKTVDGIIDILLRAYTKDCKLNEEKGIMNDSFLSFTAGILCMTPEEFANIPIMSKEEYYGE